MEARRIGFFLFFSRSFHFRALAFFVHRARVALRVRRDSNRLISRVILFVQLGSSVHIIE